MEYDDKILALAKYLEVDPEELKESGGHYDLESFSVNTGGRFPDEYAIGTDDEADSSAHEYIENSLWAFNPYFLTSHMGGIRDEFDDIQTRRDEESDRRDSKEDLEGEIEDVKAEIENCEDIIESTEDEDEYDEATDDKEGFEEELKDLEERLKDDFGDLDDDEYWQDKYDGEIYELTGQFIEDIDDLDSIVEELQTECESANDRIYDMIEDIDEFVEDAISADGRGHFLSGYDGRETEFEYNGELYYIYRIN